jgi:hypothetical protein
MIRSRYSRRYKNGSKNAKDLIHTATEQLYRSAFSPLSVGGNHNNGDNDSIFEHKAKVDGHIEMI